MASDHFGGHVRVLGGLGGRQPHRHPGIRRRIRLRRVSPEGLGGSGSRAVVAVVSIAARFCGLVIADRPARFSAANRRLRNCVRNQVSVTPSRSAASLRVNIFGWQVQPHRAL